MKASHVCFYAVLSLPIALCGQSGPLQVAPGLTITSGILPWALEQYQGKPQLVPIHHSTVEVNNHKGANIAGSLAGSVFYKPKMTTELMGLHARSVLHDSKPVFYVHLEMEDDDKAGDAPGSNTATLALVRATSTKDRRIFAQVRFTQLTGNAKRADGAVETTVEKLPGGWLKLSPVTALTSGEYAVTPIFKVQNTFSTVVYDFSLDPAAPNGADSVSPKSSQ